MRAKSWLAHLAALAVVTAFFAAWYGPAVFGGEIWTGEDTAAYFFSNRARLHAMVHETGFSWWDPLPGLGLPRLANLQSGSFAPLSLLFYAFPTATVFRFYPPLVLTLLAGFSFALFRTKGAGIPASLLGAFAFSTLGSVATHLQHPPAIETILWWPAVLAAWELHLRRRQARWVIAAGLAFAFQCFGASPQYMLYGALVTAIWMAASLWERRSDRAACLHAAGMAAVVAAIGIGIASWQLLPFAEFAGHSHRSLLAAPERFGDLYRSAPSEVLLSLAAETFWFVDAPPLVYGAPYRNLPNLSLVVVALAVAGLMRRPRPWPWGAAAAFFLIGMLGSAGGVTTLLGALVPFADRLRAPSRMIVPAGFFLCALAARGADGLLGPSRKRLASALTACAVLWVMGVAWSTRRSADVYVPPEFFAVPAALREAKPRVVVDALHSPLPSLFAMNAPLAAGVPTLLGREELIPRNFFEAYFASQFGDLDQKALLDRIIRIAALPLPKPDAPLLRAFGLRSIVRFGPEGARVEPVADALPDYFFVSETEAPATPERRWARLADRSWDPRRVAILSEPAAIPAAAAPFPAELRVREESADEQQLEVQSSGGLVVTSGLYDPGWRVWVDGEPARPLEVDGALRSVAVEAGRHRVLWRYAPGWLPAAWTGTALAVASAGAAALASRRRPRRGSA